MKRRPIILILLIVLLPMAALTWTVTRLAANEEIVLQQRYRRLMEDRLQDVNANVTLLFEELERELSRVATVDQFDIESLRQRNRSEPRLLQLFVLTADGQLAYPDPAGDLNVNERGFLIRAAQMFVGQDLREAVARAEQTAAPANRNRDSTTSLDSTYNRGQTSIWNQSRTSPPSQQVDNVQALQIPATVPSANVPTARLPVSQNPEIQQSTPQDVSQIYAGNTITALDQTDASSGWFVWYWDRGLNLIYWQRSPTGQIVGCALERARWMADLIARLPETVSASQDRSQTFTTRVRLVNSAGSEVYQWGRFEPQADARSFCEVPLVAPLSSWRLQCFVPPDQLTAGTGRSAYISLFAGLAAVAVALLVAASFFVREYARDMREAAQQVSFVNQVSHELKTPLTNIRMYAELLDSDLDTFETPEAHRPRERLAVILSEGQRLSRLIGNVLTFARQKRRTLQLQPRSISPCPVVHQIVDRFRPAFAEQQMEIDVTCQGDETLLMDPDFLEQILGNLISNVEKYAASGGLLKIVTNVEASLLTVDVTDAGPGIELSQRNLVFEPFRRISNDVSYAAGTGIGLSIARELARLHGGDLVIISTSSGCCFRATLKDLSKTTRQDS